MWPMSQFWLSQSLQIACGSFIAIFEPALKSRIFKIAILKISTVEYCIKMNTYKNLMVKTSPASSNFFHVVRNKYLYEPWKNQPGRVGDTEIMTKKRSRGQPTYVIQVFWPFPTQFSSQDWRNDNQKLEQHQFLFFTTVGLSAWVWLELNLS